MLPVEIIAVFGANCEKPYKHIWQRLAVMLPVEIIDVLDADCEKPYKHIWQNYNHMLSLAFMAVFQSSARHASRKSENYLRNTDFLKSLQKVFKFYLAFQNVVL